MKKDTLKQIFQSPYNREHWREVLAETFEVRELLGTPLLLESDELSDGYELGRLLTKDGYEMGIFEYKIKAGRKIERSRTRLRNLVSGYLKYHIDAALVVYHDDTHWRLSFICDLKDEKTAPKRFTYVFGSPDQSIKHPLNGSGALRKPEPRSPISTMRSRWISLMPISSKAIKTSISNSANTAPIRGSTAIS